MEQITMAEAARILGYHRTSVYALVKRGELRAMRHGPRSMLLSREDVEAFDARRKGRPRKLQEGPTDDR